MRRAGPGTLFSLFGLAVIGVTAFKPLKVETHDGQIQDNRTGTFVAVARPVFAAPLEELEKLVANKPLTAQDKIEVYEWILLDMDCVRNEGISTALSEALRKPEPDQQHLKQIKRWIDLRRQRFCGDGTTATFSWPYKDRNSRWDRE